MSATTRMPATLAARIPERASPTTTQAPGRAFRICGPSGRLRGGACRSRVVGTHEQLRYLEAEVYDPPLRQEPRTGRNHRPALRRQRASSPRAPSTSSTPSRFSASPRSSSPTSKSVSRSRRSCVSSRRRCASGRIRVCALRRSPAFRPRRAMFVRRPRSSSLGPRLGQRGRLRTRDSSVAPLVPSLAADHRTLRRVLPRGGVRSGAP